MRKVARLGSQDSLALFDPLDRWLAERPALRTIAVFSALPGEVDLSDFVSKHPGCQWVYPRVSGDSLTFHPVKNPAAELQSGAFGVLEPRRSLNEIPIHEIDAFFCPGLAFDRSGGRLGRGRGFYDRILATARPDALKIGICFAHQIVPDTYSEPHDIPMDAVIC